MKKALLLCASHNDLGTIRALRKLGYYITVTGNIPNLIGQRLCDRYIQADYSNKERILEIAIEEKIDAIIQCCNDFGVYTASYIAEKMGLPGYDPYETTLTLHNKDKFKALAFELGLESPISNSFISINAAKEFVKKTSFPIIIKPTDASAGIGIQRADNINEATNAIIKAFEKSRSKRIVIEPFITGQQGGFCTFLIDKRVAAFCCNNEYSFINPYRVEIDTFPADNYSHFYNQLISQIELIAERLNLKDGIFHLQYIYDGNRPMIIEVMRRILGNMYHVAGNLATSLDWEYWETRAKCGLSLHGFPSGVKHEGFYAYKTILSENNGTINSIKEPSYIKDNIIEKIILKNPKETITDYKNQPVGFYFLKFNSQRDMEEKLITNYCNDSVII